MKIVLSRKGFDSSYGGFPSPILPDGRLISFPIPSQADSYTFAHLQSGDMKMVDLVAPLTAGKYDGASRVHLDPFLSCKQPNATWRPALGQSGAAQSHLQKQGVGSGDVFLFFGWFRRVEQSLGYWRYVPTAPNLHVLFGWLEVGDVLPIVEKRADCIARYPWIATHPHVQRPDHYSDRRNTLYIASACSRYAGSTKLGGGEFRRFAPELQLTKVGATRSIWTLPAWFAPTNGRPPLTYHRKQAQWKLSGDSVELASAGKGQEFVLDAQHYPEAEAWLRALIGNHAD